MEYESLLKLSYIDTEKYNAVYQSRISNECATVLNFHIAGNQAFYLTNQELLLLITKIMSVDKALTERSSVLPPIALKQFTKQALIDEIKQTNDIENVYSTKKEIRETLNRIDKGQNKGRFKGLISKYIRLQSDESIRLETCEDVRTLYDELVLEEVLEEDGGNAPDGVLFRKGDVSVYSESGKEIHTGLYPEVNIINAMSAALMILNDDKTNYLISAAVFHYLFAYIHPFYDGNGRTDRFISSYYISKNLNHLVAYRLSYIIKKNKAKYYKMFSETNQPRNRGDLTPFVIQFLELILEAEKDLCEELDRRIKILSFGKERINQLKVSDNDKTIAYVLLQNALFDDEGLMAEEISAICRKCYATITKSLEVLNGLNLLRCTTSGRRKLYEINLNELIK